MFPLTICFPSLWFFVVYVDRYRRKWQKKSFKIFATKQSTGRAYREVQRSYSIQIQSTSYWQRKDDSSTLISGIHDYPNGQTESWKISNMDLVRCHGDKPLLSGTLSSLSTEASSTCTKDRNIEIWQEQAGECNWSPSSNHGNAKSNAYLSFVGTRRSRHSRIASIVQHVLWGYHG